jgi:hypothetical protein
MQKSTKPVIYKSRDEKPGYKPIELRVVIENDGRYRVLRETYGPRNGVVFRESITLSLQEFLDISEAINQNALTH